MRLLIIALVLVLATPCPRAQNTTCFRMPPMRYIHEPTMPYVIHYVAPEDLHDLCNPGIWAAAPTPQACTFMDTRVVYIPTDVKGLELRCLIMHEKAHLNGWPANHPIR